MGFREEIETIIKALPEERQTLLFSATMPKAILEITEQYQNNPILIKTPQEQITTSNVEQFYYEVNQGAKKDLQVQLLEIYRPNLSMIFCNTKKMVDDLTATLQGHGYQAACIHGDMKQEMRSIVMQKFKEKKISILVATDVAARGIDVDDMDVVFNYDVPQELEYYVHRIGRTARAGKTGVAITFVTPRQKNYLKQIERLTKSEIIRKELPKQEDLRDLRIKLLKDEIDAVTMSDISDEVEVVLSKLKAEGYQEHHLLKVLLHERLENEAMKEIENPIKDKRVITHKAMTKIQLNVGKNQKISAAHILAAITETCGVEGRDIGKIQIKDHYSVVEIPSQYDAKMMEEISNTTIRGLTVKVTTFISDGKEKNNKEKRKTNRLKGERVSDFKQSPDKKQSDKDYRKLPRKGNSKKQNTRKKK